MALNTGYVVPAGYIAVVRDVTAVFEGTPEDTALAVYEPSTNTHVFYHLQVNQDEFAHWDGRQVFDTGSEIHATSAGPNTVHVRVSGYLLTLP